MPGTIFKLAFALALASSCAAQVLVNGAGATFAWPVYSRWFRQYQAVDSRAVFNYQSNGSAAGIRQFQAGALDFAASDSPLSDEQIASSGTRPLHFPTVLGAVVAAYNIPGLKRELNFTAEALAGIFLGEVTRWNDPRIAAANRGVSLPDAEIVVVHRSDGSGTTFVWTDFLSKTSPAWKARVGAGTSVHWPAGLAARGNEGVAGIVRQTPNAIGYVELIYAVETGMQYGRVRNASGAFVKADRASVSAAAAGAAKTMPDDFRVSITDAPGRNAYPVSSFTWLLAPEEISDATKRAFLTGFLRWMLGPGQKEAGRLGYGPLPAQVIAKEIKAIARVR